MDGADIETSVLRSRTDLAGLKTKLGSLGTNRLKIMSPDLSKLNNILDNGVIKKEVSSKLVVKLTDIDTKISSTSKLATKTKYDSDKKGLEKNIDYSMLRPNI